MSKRLDLAGLPAPAAKKLKSYLVELITITGKPLEAVVAYGSAVTSEFDPRRSNINLLVVVERLDLELLHRVQPLVRRGARRGIVAPLFLTHEHMRTSSDVFPIEFLDMSDFHLVLYGDDPFKGLKIGTENLRLECEEKLKGTLINLRQSYLEIADRRAAMMRLVASSITGLVSIFRGLIRLAGRKAPAGKKDVVERMAELYPVQARNFLTALEIKFTAPHMTRDEMDAFFAAYLDDIQKLAVHVDMMGKRRRRKTTRKPTLKKSTGGKKIAARKSPRRSK